MMVYHLRKLQKAMAETTTALQRIRTLAIQSQNGINSEADREALQKEVDALRTEISRIATTTQFAGVDVLSGAFSAKFLVGANAGQITFVNLSAPALTRAIVAGFSATGLGITSDNVLTEDSAANLLTAVDTAISAIGGLRADLGALQTAFNRLFVT